MMLQRFPVVSKPASRPAAARPVPSVISRGLRVVVKALQQREAPAASISPAIQLSLFSMMATAAPALAEADPLHGNFGFSPIEIGILSTPILVYLGFNVFR